MSWNWTLTTDDRQVVFGDDDALVVVDEWSSSAGKLRIDDHENPRGDGLRFGSDFRSGQVVDFSMWVNGGDEDTARAGLASLQAAWRNDVSRRRGGSICRLEHPRGRAAFGRPRGFSADTQRIEQGWVTIKADFEAVDDLWYGPEEVTSIRFVPPVRVRTFSWLGVPDASVSVERVEGVEVARNLFTNPRFAATDGVVEVRRNRVPNPLASNAGTVVGWERRATESTGVPAWVTDHLEVDVTVTGGGVFAAIGNGGAQVSATVQAPVGYRAELLLYNVTDAVWSTPAIGPLDGSEVRLTVPAWAVAAGKGVRVYARLAGVGLLKVKEVTTDPLGFFAVGLPSPAPDLTPAWTGTPNNSPSILTGHKAAGVTGGYITSQFPGHGSALRVPAGGTATITVAGAGVGVVTARNAGQTINGGVSVVGENRVSSGTLTLGPGDWALFGMFVAGYTGPVFHGDTPDVGVGLAIPAAVPFVLGAGSGVSEYMVTVGGDVATQPVFELHGPILDPFVEVVGVGRLIFRGQLAYDQTLTVDTRHWARWVKRDGAAFPGALSPAGSRLSDMSMRPGAYQVFFGGYDPTGTSSLDVRVSPAFTSF